MKVTTGHTITTLTLRKAIQKEAYHQMQKKARKHHTKADLERLWSKCCELAAKKAHRVFGAELAEREAIARAVVDWGGKAEPDPEPAPEGQPPEAASE